MMAKTKTHLFRVQRGALVPADALAESILRDGNYRVGDEVSVTIRKARSPGLHRRAHLFGAMLVENIDSFAGLDAHRALKRIQIEAGIECDEMSIYVKGMGFVPVRTPRSMSYGNMDAAEFEAMYQQMCRWVAQTYWPQCDENEVARMAEFSI